MVTHRIPKRLGLVAEEADGHATLYAAPLPDGPIVVLRDTALTIWREAVAPSSDLPLPERVAEAYGRSSSELETAVRDCIAELVRIGVLEELPR